MKKNWVIKNKKKYLNWKKKPRVKLNSKAMKNAEKLFHVTPKNSVRKWRKRTPVIKKVWTLYTPRVITENIYRCDLNMEWYIFILNPRFQPRYLARSPEGGSQKLAPFYPDLDHSVYFVLWYWRDQSLSVWRMPVEVYILRFTLL